MTLVQGFMLLQEEQKCGGGKSSKAPFSPQVEPYAYWPLDRKMLNRRNAKKAEAKRGLSEVVTPVAKGHKAKKQKRSA